MYIIEKLVKTYLKYTKKEHTVPVSLENQSQELEDVITCEHRFMPIDSTGKILACSKCGYLITRTRLNKNRNFFKYQ